MSQAARDPKASPEGAAPQDSALARAAADWVGRLARTLKTCRLYDAGNPTVVRFREELAATLAGLLNEHGTLTLKFSSTDVLLGEASLYPARSREDNLGLPFCRDGIKSLTLLPGVEPGEVDVLVDALLQVTGHAGGDADLVSILWDAELAHLSVDYVSLDAEMEEGGEEGAADEAGSGAPLMPWPGTGSAAGDVGAPEGDAAPAGEATAAADAAAQGPAGERARSDDWTAADMARLVDIAVGDLEERARAEVHRLRVEYDAECARGVLVGSLALMRECIDSGADEADREELGRFVARLLQDAMAGAAWNEARQAAGLLRGQPAGEAALARMLESFARPDSLVTADIVRELDRQGVHGVQEFLAFAQQLGPPAVQWLMHVVAESGQQRTRRMVARAIAELCRESPEVLAPWLADERWYVVRNVAHILGFVGGPAVVGMLQAVCRHSDPRVRQEVVTALATVDRATARSVLVGMLQGADTKILCAVLHQLSTARDPLLAQILLAYLTTDSYHERPAEERHAICSALGSVGDDAALPRLEAELHRGQWPSSAREAHRQDIARCIARIGTPAAREVLEQGARSRHAGVRGACAEALAGGRPRE